MGPDFLGRFLFRCDLMNEYVVSYFERAARNHVRFSCTCGWGLFVLRVVLIYCFIYPFIPLAFPVPRPAGMYQHCIYEGN